MHLKANEPNEPFDPMVAWADGRRSAAPENSLRHVLKSHGHDVTNFDDTTMTQQDRTISALFEQMRPELDSVFGRAITTDIKNVFLKKSGPHLRHSLAHGLLPDGAAYGAGAIYGCWFIFHLCMLPLFPIRAQLALPYDLTQSEAITSLVEVT